MQRKHLIVAIVAGLGLAGAIAYAANRGMFLSPLTAPISAVSSDAAPQSWDRPVASDAASLPMAGRRAMKPRGPTAADVGDLDSYGRNVRWLGAAVGYAGVASPEQCTAWATSDPNYPCRPIADPEVGTSFSMQDIARISLPAGASNSMFCHSVNPLIQVWFRNTSSDMQVSKFLYNVGAYVENPVLMTPGLTDPGTGAPMNGVLWISMGYESFNQLVPPNTTQLQTMQASKVCGLDNQISKQSLVQNYGLSQAQADEFFTKPTTIRLAVGGSVQRVLLAKFYVNLRLTGD